MVAGARNPDTGHDPGVDEHLVVEQQFVGRTRQRGMVRQRVERLKVLDLSVDPECHGCRAALSFSVHASFV